MQNCPGSESQVVRSGCIEVVDDCSPTIYNCKLTSLANGKSCLFCPHDVQNKKMFAVNLKFPILVTINNVSC